ncbi:MAG TPA: hypothetical protein VFU88_13715 [Ktedonobacterales bacterium]|nr:hypothetical protein [Ktedonobacterales bacterium]
MQPTSRSFDWSRVVEGARLVARLLGIIVGGFLGFWALSSAINGTISGGAEWTGWLSAVLYSLPLVIVVAAIFWKGIGEVVGGLALVAIAVWMFVPAGPIFSGAVALAGLLLVACGWYTLVQQRHHVTHATA